MRGPTIRTVLAALAVALVLVIAVAYDQATFTIHPLVEYADAPDLVMGPRNTGGVRLTHLRCAPDSSQYVNDRGELVGFNGATPIPPRPEPLCEAARGERRGHVIAFTAAGVLVGGGLVLVRVLQRRLLQGDEWRTRSVLSGAPPNGGSSADAD